MTSSENTLDQMTKLLGGASVGFGVVGMLAPAALRRSYGMKASDPGGELAYLGRMWGTRTLVLGAVALGARTPEEQRRVLMLAAGMNAFDALTAATTGALPSKTRAMGALTSGFFAASSAYGATTD
jgi:hypothetical protein